MADWQFVMPDLTPRIHRGLGALQGNCRLSPMANMGAVAPKLRFRNQAPQRQQDRFRRCSDLKPIKQMGALQLNRSYADSERNGNHFAGVSFHQRTQQLPLGWTQRRKPVGRIQRLYTPLVRRRRRLGDLPHPSMISHPLLHFAMAM